MKPLALMSHEEYIAMMKARDDALRRRFMGQLEDPHRPLERWEHDRSSGEWRIVRTDDEDGLEEMLRLAYS